MHFLSCRLFRTKGQYNEYKSHKKIIEEISSFPEQKMPEIVPNKVNEPLADNRIFDILDLISSKIKKAKIYFVTNGTLLSEKGIDELSKHNLSKLNVSLNFCDQGNYEKNMHLIWDKTIRNLDMLKKKVKGKAFAHPVYISRVKDETEYDIIFERWANKNYPEFTCWMKKSGDWLNSVPKWPANNHPVSKFCGQWSNFSITSTGDVSFCCMDAFAN